MKKIYKIFALCLAAVTVVSLAACSNTGDAENPGSPAAGSSSDSASSVNEQANGKDDPAAVTEGMSSDVQAFDFESEIFVPTKQNGKEGFSEDIIWGMAKSIDGDEGGRLLTAVTRDGKVVYQQARESEAEATPFCDGASLVIPKGEGPAYIIDNQGNVLYTAKAEDDDQEKIIAGGGGTYLMTITQSSISDVSVTFGVIDKSGNKLFDFMNAGDYQDDKQTLTADIADYLGDSVYLIDRRWLYDAESNKISSAYDIDCGKKDYTINFVDESKGYFDGAKGWVTVYTGMKTYPAILDAKNLSLKIIEDADENYRIDGKTLIAGRVCYDLDGGKTEVTIFPDQKIEISGFSDEGYAAVMIEGVDGGKYLTYVDKDGAQQFEPLKGEKWVYGANYTNMCYGVTDPQRGDRLFVYDHSGKETYALTIAPTDATEAELHDEYAAYKEHIILLENYKA